MKDFAKKKLIRQALTELAKEDFVAQSIIFYYDQLDRIVDLRKSGKLTNEEWVKFYDSYYNLLSLFKQVIPEEYEKEKDKSEVNDLVSLYILRNFIKLCPSNSLKTYYERILFLRTRLSKNFSLTMELAIILRTNEILKKITDKYGYDTANRFLSFLESSRESEDQLLYIIYYGLFDGTIINNYMVDNGMKVKNDIVAESLLDNDEKLPDSIITHICNDEQFKDFNPQVVLFLIQRFFMFRLDMKLEDDDMLDIIQKIFNNNVRDFNTEAEFLNLEEFLVKVNECFNGKLEDDELYTYFLQIVNGIETLDRRDDGKNHGSI